MNKKYCKYKDVCEKACSVKRTCTAKEEATCDLEIAFCNTFNEKEKCEANYELCY